MRPPKSLMRFLTTFAPSPLTAPLLLIAAVGIVLSLPTAVQAQYSFGDWAISQGYQPGDTMPQVVSLSSSSPNITDLAGIGDYDWNATPTTSLYLSTNDISNIESGAFSGLTNLGILYLTQADYDAFNTAGGGLLAIWDAESGHHVQIVPEPATMTLLTLGGLVILRKRRK